MNRHPQSDLGWRFPDRPAAGQRSAAWPGCTWKLRLRPLASIGRMAISNYLLQTLICTTLFYGYGFGLYGQVGAAAGVLLTLAIYALQIPLSVWWLHHFRFGPVEWLWRSLTYGYRQPMRYPPADTSDRGRPASLGGRP